MMTTKSQPTSTLLQRKGSSYISNLAYDRRDGGRCQADMESAVPGIFAKSKGIDYRSDSSMRRFLHHDSSVHLTSAFCIKH